MKSKNATTQESYRKRKAQEGLFEVRGIYATKEDGEIIKRFAKNLTKSRLKEWLI